jgi:hypothetical protein
LRKVLFIIIIAVFALVILFTARPFLARLLRAPAASEPVVLETIISLVPITQLSIIQGKSDQALILSNMTTTPVKFNLGHAHGHLTLDPRSETLQPGASENITIHVDDFCPRGEIDLLVFLQAEVEGETFNMETFNLLFTVLPGELKLQQENNNIIVIWNDAPAPPGVFLYYRNPEDDEDEVWKYWGETPDLYPPPGLEAGLYIFEFIARLGAEESAVETFEIFIEEL